ncbi:hypothetical protein [Polycladidibacter hongkongensis]|uniref:hypothetical protein n=1 Tax=Polycladidibacter hongkongensis TaxID=1647556 RepID=UPI0008332C19|nr:hypothetical protein [Pseudovibrio hongkongensis]
MSDFQASVNQFLETIGIDQILEDDPDSELLIDVNESFSMLFSFEQEKEEAILRVVFNDTPTDAKVLTTLLENSNSISIAGKTLSFGIESALASAYGEIRVPEGEFEVSHLEAAFPIFLQISEWYDEVKTGAAPELLAQDQAQMWC